MSDVNHEAVRNAIMKLLSDSENAKVSTAEDSKKLNTGEEFIDLSNLGAGVQKAASAGASDMGDIIPKSAVGKSTWDQIVGHLPKA